MHTTFLLEIGTEELPAIPFLAELPNIKAKFSKILESYRLTCDFDFFYTPRRLVIISQKFPLKQEIKEEEFFGPPLNIAYKEGELTQAALSFLKKCKITKEEISTSFKDGKEVLYCKKQAILEDSKELIPIIAEEFLQSLNFGKTMRWGESKEVFIRPIRWILSLLGDKLIPVSLFGIQSQRNTYIHRSVDFSPREILGFQSYFETLKENYVILDPILRKEKILTEIEAIEKSKGIKIELDLELLEEVVAITEYPTALYGEYSEHFLELPPSCIITSMKVNQRYFATYKDEKLHNSFILISNSLAKDSKEIVSGNVKVLRARLEDALFFYHNDLKSGFKPERLKNVTFVEGLGSMWDKSQREGKIAQILAEILQEKIAQEEPDFSLAREILNQATYYAKADLLTEMVYEFTELQGIMGYYYANALGYDKRIALALKEQYYPKSEEGELPSNIFSAIVALSFKLDNLLGLFSIQKIPSGSRDPFALRRAANGVIKIILQFNLSLNLKTLLKKLAPFYKDFNLDSLENFILERMESLLPFNASLFRAVIASGERDILEISEKLNALNSALNRQDKNTLTQTFKRLANITKDVNLDSNLTLQEEKFTQKEELDLFNAFSKLTLQNMDYLARLDSLLSLNPLLKNFFDNVLVNAQDESLKNNRKNLIARIYKEFLEIADIKEISF